MENKAKHNKNKLISLCILLGVCVGGMGFFGISLLREMHEVGQGQAFYASLSVDFKQRLPQPAQRLPGAEPVAAEAFVPFVDFDELREVFPNIVGWIQSEGTVINYPIVQAEDNDFYLYHLPDGSRHAMGSIFLDYRNAADFSDRNIVIYGHDMRSGDKFGSFRHYRDQDYFERHHSMFVFTPYRNYELMLVAGYVLDSAQEVPPMWFRDAMDFDEYMADILRRSIFQSDVVANFGDRLVFLATCTPTGSIDERLIIVGVLAEI
ncbi:MAG: class B sortase [Defluviitaleaceae bacterium]|nr:class B sortase [Defluviitaleaceae bacterium]